MEDCGRWLLSGVDEPELMSGGDVMLGITVNPQWVRPLQRHGVMHRLRLLP